MKCSKCESDKLDEITLLTNEGSKLTDVECYACLECGHIEIYLSANKIERLKKQQSNNTVDESNTSDQENMKSNKHPFGY
jgi:predicted nucleic-acid-binding Zn-ribbon protein